VLSVFFKGRHWIAMLLNVLGVAAAAAATQ